jgi:hypothetical protein
MTATEPLIQSRYRLGFEIGGTFTVFVRRPLMAPGPEDLYVVINERCENCAILLTSNRTPAE